MRSACDSDSRCGLACDASARDAKSLAICGSSDASPLRRAPYNGKQVTFSATWVQLLGSRLRLVFQDREGRGMLLKTTPSGQWCVLQR